MTRRTRIGLLGALAALALVATASAEARTYHGYVNGSSVTLLNSSGARVSSVPVGRHTFVIHDSSRSHNWVLYRGSTRLFGTGLAQTGVMSRTIRVSSGSYRYVCTAHAQRMRGFFTAR